MNKLMCDGGERNIICYSNKSNGTEPRVTHRFTGSLKYPPGCRKNRRIKSLPTCPRPGCSRDSNLFPVNIIFINPKENSSGNIKNGGNSFKNGAN